MNEFKPEFKPEQFKPEFKPETVLIGTPPRYGKTAFLKALEEITTPRCVRCGAKLSKYWYYTENYMFQKCCKCGEENKRKRGDY